MEFIEFDSFNDNNPPQDSALSIDIPTNIENLSKKIPNLNGFRNLLQFEDQKSSSSTTSTSTSTKDIEENDISQQYAKLSLELVSKNGVQTEEKKDSVPASNYNFSNKLSKVLNSSVNEELIREIFNLNLDEEDLIDSNITGSISRKNLRSKIETDLIRSQSLLLKEYNPLIKQLKAIDDKLSHLNTINNINNDDMKIAFNDLQQFNKSFASLNQEKQIINLKKNLLSNFKNKFILNEFEEFVISNNEINEEFFNVLTKLDTINGNSSILLAIENSNLGVNIMHKISKLINKSNDTLFNYLKRLINNPYFLNSSTKLRHFHICLKILNKKNHIMFDQLIEELVHDRSKQLINDFLNQVNILNSHDNVRLIGDLLASVHSMVLNEMENIDLTFSINDEEFNSLTSFSLTEDDKPMFINIKNNLLNKIFERLSKSIKSKLEQLISIETKLKIIYSIFNLFELYKLMFDKIFKSNDSSMIILMNQLVKFSQNKISSVIDNELKSINTSNQAQLDISSDLQPPEWIIEFYSNILPMIDQSKASFDSVLNLTDSELPEFLLKIINEPINIFIGHVKTKHFNSFEQIILKINFIDVILSKTLAFPTLQIKVDELNQMVSSLQNDLVNLQFKSLLQQCKLYDFSNIVNMIIPFSDDFFDVSMYEPIKENKLFTKDNINLANEAMADYIPNALIEIQNSLLKVNSPLIVNEVIQTCSIDFVKFCFKFNMIVKEYLQVSLIWSDIEIATLLGVEDFYQQEKQNMVLD